MQPPRLHAIPDRVVTESDRQQLSPAHNSVLTLRQPRHLPVR
jgi:hypothetical protein